MEKQMLIEAIEEQIAEYEKLIDTNTDIIISLRNQMDGLKISSKSHVERIRKLSKKIDELKGE